MPSLRGKEQELKSKYIKNPEGRIFLNNKNLCKLPEMTSVNIEGFENPVPETVEQLEKMKAAKPAAPKQEEPETPAIPTDGLTLDDFAGDDIFDFSKANRAVIAKKAKEMFNVDMAIIDKDISDVRAEFSQLVEQNDNTGAGSN